MSRFRCYIDPFDDNGNLTGYQEVTDDIDFGGLGTINRKIDNDEYNVGLFRYNDFTIRLNNETGKYSDVDVLASIFRYSRTGARFKITWQLEDQAPLCGIAICGAARLSSEVDVYVGLINDEATRLDITEQKISFKVLGLESIFSRVEAPYASISNGDLYSAILLTILNQAAITKYLTVSAGNINVGLDIAIDDKSDYENKTVKDVLDSVLFASNSFLYIKDDTVYVDDRTADVSSSKTFYGQASNNGVEDIVRLSDISTGLNKAFNYWTWTDTALVSQDTTSVGKYGVRKKDIKFDEITNSSKRQQILDEQKTEFAFPKKSFNLTTFLDYDTIALTFMNRVLVDYPTVFIPADVEADLPIYGVAQYGTDKYPIGTYSITISTSDAFKITGIKILTKDQLIQFNLEEI